MQERKGVLPASCMSHIRKHHIHASLTAFSEWGTLRNVAHSKAFFSACHCDARNGYCAAHQNLGIRIFTQVSNRELHSFSPREIGRM